MKQLDTIIQKLKKDQYFAVTITDSDSFKNVCTNRLAAQMVEDSGSVENFFNGIVEKGHIEIAIQPRRKNGSSFKDDGPPVKLSLRPKGEQYHEATPMPANSALQPSHVNSPMFGLMAGLNGMDMAYRYQDYPKLERENERLKLENEQHKEKIAELKEELLKRDFSENKAAGNKELISELLGALPGVMGAFASAKGAAGLNGAQAATEQLSENKQMLINALKGQHDGIAYYMNAVLEGMTTNEAFGKELLNLLQTNKLIPTENANQ